MPALHCACSILTRQMTAGCQCDDICGLPAVFVTVCSSAVGKDRPLCRSCVIDALPGMQLLQRWTQTGLPAACGKELEQHSEAFRMQHVCGRPGCVRRAPPETFAIMEGSFHSARAFWNCARPMISLDLK